MAAMPIVAHTHPFVVGVDTHARNHVYAIVAAHTGELIDTQQFPTTISGINRALTWVARRTDGNTDTLWAVEGAASYGATLVGAIIDAGYPVAEAPRVDARKRYGIGKSDELDAHHIAASTLAIHVYKLRRPRLGEGIRQAVRILLTARESMTSDRTRSVNSLTALLRSHDLGLDARRVLTAAQTVEVSRWRAREEELSARIARTEAVRLAKRVLEIEAQLKENEKQLTELVQVSEAAPLLQEKGFGPVTAATCLAAWSHQGRVRSEAAYASLAGVSPIPASSGNTTRHRLNRGGDRRLNSTLHMVAITRMTHDEETRAYTERRRAEGRTDREIRRCIKRYLARRVFRTLSASKVV